MMHRIKIDKITQSSLNRWLCKQRLWLCPGASGVTQADWLHILKLIQTGSSLFERGFIICIQKVIGAKQDYGERISRSGKAYFKAVFVKYSGVI